MLFRNTRRFLKGWVRPRKREIGKLIKRIDRAATPLALREELGGKGEVLLEDILHALSRRHKYSHRIAKRLALERAMNAAGIFSPGKRAVIRRLLGKELESGTDPEVAKRIREKNISIVYKEVGLLKTRLLLKRYSQTLLKIGRGSGAPKRRGK